VAKYAIRAAGALILGLYVVPVFAGFAKTVIKVPPGNRNAQMPDLPDSTIGRRDARPGKRPRSFDAAYIQAMNKLNDRGTRETVAQVARIYGVDPVHIFAVLVGEHTFNVGGADTLQNMIMRAAIMGPSWAIQFNNNAVNLGDLLREPIMAGCMAQTSDYYKWECVRVTWESKLRGREYNGVAVSGRMPAKSFRSAFFNPIKTGHTYGLGQLDPQKALMLSDIVARYGGLKPLSIDDPADVYSAIIDPTRSLHYTAALVRTIQDFYRDIGGFDITDNPGITATLYNIGFELQRAQKIANVNRKSHEVVYPEENYYGWAVNAKLEDIRLLVAGQWRGQSVVNVSLDQAADETIARQTGKPIAADPDDGVGPALNLFDFFRR
jgi:hypothetical protein